MSVDPKDFGMVRDDANSEKISRGGITAFHETFQRDRDYTLAILRMPSDNLELNKVYDRVMLSNIDSLTPHLAPGEGVRIVGEGKPKAITLDKMDGING
jgi:hypothetical protein